MDEFEENNKDNGKLFKGIALGLGISIALQAGFTFFNGSIANVFAKDTSYEEKIQDIYKVLQDNYVDEINDEDLEDMMYTGLVAGLGDPYSVYMNQENFQSFMESSEGTYYGIGAVVSPSDDNKVLVVTPYEGAPAYNAGIRSGDKILKVNGTEVYGSALDEAVSLIKGEKGTTVSVEVEKTDGTVVTLDVYRDEITIPTIDYEMLENDLGYIQISAFDRVTEDQFNEAYDELLSKNMNGLIIDLRNNPGGLLDVVSNITDRLIPKGFITYTEDKDGKREYIYSDSEEIEIPLVILVNENSASASEVLSGAVKDTGKGILVGETTFGKGLVQNIFPLSDGSAVKTTIARYYTPSGVCIHGIGIEPNYVVDISEEDAANLAMIEFEDDVQLQKAIEVLENEVSK